MSIPVRMSPRADDFRKPNDFVEAALEAARRVPVVRRGHLPVDVLVPPEPFRRAMLCPWADGDDRSVMDVAVQALARANPRAQIVDVGSIEELDALQAWGEELLDVIEDAANINPEGYRRLGHEDAVILMLNDEESGVYGPRRLAEILGLDYELLLARSVKGRG